MNIVKIDGSTIKILREQQELTQLYLATAVGVTTDTISRWENKRYPTIKQENAEKLAEALGVTLDALLEQDELLNEQAGGQQVEEVATPPADPTQKNRFTKRTIAVLILLVGLVVSAIVFVGLPSFKNIQIRCKRIMPEHAAANVPFPVIVQIEADGDPGDVPILIREALSGDAYASGWDSSGEIKHFAKNPRWIGTLSHGQATFAYMVTPGKGEESGMTIGFSGDIVTRKAPQSSGVIEGASAIHIVPYHWADEDMDYRISDDEILIAYETYSLPDKEGIDLSSLEKLWLAGGYRWDAVSTSFAPANPPQPTQSGE